MLKDKATNLGIPHKPPHIDMRAWENFYWSLMVLNHVAMVGGSEITHE